MMKLRTSLEVSQQKGRILEKASGISRNTQASHRARVGVGPFDTSCSETLQAKAKDRHSDESPTPNPYNIKFSKAESHISTCPVNFAPTPDISRLQLLDVNASSLWHHLRARTSVPSESSELCPHRTYGSDAQACGLEG